MQPFHEKKKLVVAKAASAVSFNLAHDRLIETVRQTGKASGGRARKQAGDPVRVSRLQSRAGRTG